MWMPGNVSNYQIQSPWQIKVKQQLQALLPGGQSSCKVPPLWATKSKKAPLGSVVSSRSQVAPNEWLKYEQCAKQTTEEEVLLPLIIEGHLDKDQGKATTLFFIGQGFSLGKGPVNRCVIFLFLQHWQSLWHEPRSSATFTQDDAAAKYVPESLQGFPRFGSWDSFWDRPVSFRRFCPVDILKL